MVSRMLAGFIMLYSFISIIQDKRMNELNPKQVKIDDAFWSPKLRVNAVNSIFHQWEMLEASGCIDNFRIAAGEKQGFRVGWFFADSDATKWLDAAARIERNHHDAELCRLMDGFIDLLARAQMPDGYLFTYNQIHFPGQRWVNLQVEHELYCHGHLIEAGVSHFEATGQEKMLMIARKAADLIVHDFEDGGPKSTPGHEEIEIALLQLFMVTGHEPYRQTARHFLEVRGKIPFFGISLIKQFSSNARREKLIAKRLTDYKSTHPDLAVGKIPAMNEAKRPPFSLLRFYLSGLSGKYFQQHRPIREQKVPVGHSVRFGYLETAEAMLLRGEKGEKLLQTMEIAWERMVTRRMDVTGGLGAQPDSEGFGRDYELDPEVAYNETCAAIASLYWNWQLACLTGKARYSDLFEWQLYNAVSVGVGLEGKNYFYNNPTLCRDGITRQPWYSIPCCPSNIARTYADLGKYVITYEGQDLFIHQYIGCEAGLAEWNGLRVEIKSELPVNGRVVIKVNMPRPQAITVKLRSPSWVSQFSMNVDGNPLSADPMSSSELEPTATGCDPRKAEFVSIPLLGEGNHTLEIQMKMPIRVLRPHPKVKALRGKVAISRGPVVFCLENIDNARTDIFNDVVDAKTLEYEYLNGLLGGTGCVAGRTIGGNPVLFIPYALRGNRGASAMTTWVRING